MVLLLVPMLAMAQVDFNKRPDDDLGNVYISSLVKITTNSKILALQRIILKKRSACNRTMNGF